MVMHSIFGSGALTPDLALANDGTGSIQVGNVFYLVNGTPEYTCRGARLWLPSEVTVPAQVTIEARYDVTAADQNNLDTPALRSATVATGGVSGWLDVSWAPFTVEAGKMVLISYSFSGGERVYLYRIEPSDDAVQASDGSPLYRSERTTPPYSSGYFRMDSNAPQAPPGTFTYGVDILLDDTRSLAEYGFNETGGTTAADETDNHRDMTVNSPSNFDVSRTGNGLHQVGGGLTNRIAMAASWFEVPQRTVMFWARRGNAGTSDSRTVYQMNGSAQTVFGISLSDGTQTRFTARIGGAPVEVTVPVQAAGDWNHYALTYDGASLEAYIDGVSVGAQAVAGALDTGDGQVYVYGEEYQQQVIDDLRFFDSALTEADIASYMADTIVPPDLDPPTTPTNLSATTSGQQVTLTWDASTDNIEVQNYVVYRSQTSGFTPGPTHQVGGPAGTSFSDVAAAGTWYYVVVARDEAGNVSAPSAECEVTTTAAVGDEYHFPSSTGLTPGPVFTDGTATGMSYGQFFGVDRPVPITGIRFYAPTAATGVTINLTEDGATTILATATDLTLSVGWNALSFETPHVAVFGVGYVASIFVPGTTVSYTALVDTFNGDRMSAGPVYLQNPLGGRYSYNAVLPVSQTGTWYGVDVVALDTGSEFNGSYGADIVAENAMAGSSSERWSIAGVGDTANLGFARQFSVNAGETIDFSCHGPGEVLDIYRIGSYGGVGWRQVASISNTPTMQPDPEVVPGSNGGVACTNWSTTASWTVPAEAISGLFVGVYRNVAQNNASYIPFCVRNDSRAADVIVKLSETTWALAYNYYGTPGSPLTGKSVYGSGGPLGDIGTRAHIGSYHRPIVTRAGIPQTYWMACEAPLIRYLESNGFNVKYVASKDVDESPAVLNLSKMVVSSGHDEYWSDGMRDAFEAYRDSGRHVLFMSGNEVFWRIRFSADHSMMWVYKDTMDGPGAHVGGTPLDPVSWTGTWKDTRWPGNKAEKTITGTDFRMNGVHDHAAVFDHTADYASHPFWRETAVANGSTVTVQGIIGFEADEMAPMQPAPSTAVLAAHTININGSRADDNGASYNGNGDLAWGVVSQRYASGAVVVGFGTCQWAWGLDNVHDRGSAYATPALRQATLNLFTDLGATPATVNADLTAATAVASLDVYGLVPVGARSGKVKVWDGSDWSAHPLKVWDGAAWVTRPVSGYDGSEHVVGK